MRTKHLSVAIENLKFFLYMYIFVLLSFLLNSCNSQNANNDKKSNDTLSSVVEHDSNREIHSGDLRAVSEDSSSAGRNGSYEVSATDSFSSVNESSTNAEVTILQFGAKGDGVTDDSQALLRAVEFLKKSRNQNGTLIFPSGDYAIGQDIHVSNIHFKGSGRLVPVKGKRDFILRVQGDNNTFDGLSFFQSQYTQNLLIIDGDGNQVLNCVFDTPEKSSSATVVYSDCLLSIVKNDGRNNVVKGSKFNNGRVGVALSGSYKLLDSEVSNCIMGVWARPSTRNSEIARNVIRDNNVNSKSGADGILAQRNVSNLHIHHNKISNSGEHGIYFQGDGSIIENNEVFENQKSGIKLASYNTQLYNDGTGKTENYVGHNNIVRRNKCYNNCINPKDKTNAGIYLQAPLRDIDVVDNTCYGNYYGIRSTSVSGLKEEELATKGVLSNLRFTGNTAIDNRGRSLYIEGESGIVIEMNKADAIVTNAKSTSHRMKAPIIRGNEVKNQLLINRAEGSIIENNEINELSVSSNSIKSAHKMMNNRIKTSNYKAGNDK